MVEAPGDESVHRTPVRVVDLETRSCLKAGLAVTVPGSGHSQHVLERLQVDPSKIAWACVQDWHFYHSGGGPEQLRQELVARDATIGDLQQKLIAERRAKHELQDAVNYLQEQQVYALLFERQQLLLCFATCAAQAHAFVGGM